MKPSKIDSRTTPAPKLTLTDQEVQDRIGAIGYEIALLTAPPHIVNKMVREREELQWRLWVARYLRNLSTASKTATMQPPTTGGFW